MSRRLAVVTLAIGPWKDLPVVHDPMARLAEHLGADFLKITERRHPDWHVYYEKTQIREILQAYDGVLYLDGDVLVTPRAFDENYWEKKIITDQKYTMLFDERSRSDHYTRSEVNAQYTLVGKKIPEQWNGRHYNTGVMYIPRQCAFMLDDPIVTSISYQDQAWLNWKIAENIIPVEPMPWVLNCMPFVCLDVNPGDAVLVHYAGYSNYIEGLDALMHLMKAWPWVPPQYRPRLKYPALTSQFGIPQEVRDLLERKPPQRRAGRRQGGR